MKKTFAVLLCLTVFSLSASAQSKKQDLMHADSLSQLSGKMSERQAYDSANRVLAEAEKIYEKYQHKDNLLSVRFAAAVNDYYSGKAQEAFAAMKELEKYGRREPPVRTEDFGRLLKTLGFFYASSGKNEAALRYFREATELIIEASNDNNPELIGVYDNTGAIVARLSRHREAGEFYKLAVSTAEKSIGKEHPLYANSCNNLGLNYKLFGNYDSAYYFLEEARRAYEKAVGAQSKEVGDMFLNLGTIYEADERYDKALEHYQKAQEIFKTMNEGINPDIAKVYNNIGVLYYYRGYLKEAAEYYLKAVEVRKKCPPDPFSEADTYNNLGTIYQRMGASNKAREFFRKSLQLHEEVHGRESAQYATVLTNLQFGFVEEGLYEEALELSAEALKTRIKIFGEDHPDVARSYHNIYMIFFSQDRYDSAAYYLNKAYQIRNKIMAPDHAEVLFTELGFAAIAIKTGLYKEAEAYIRGIERYDKHREMPQLTNLYENTAILKAETGDPELAAEYMHKAVYTELKTDEMPPVNQTTIPADARISFNALEPLKFKARYQVQAGNRGDALRTYSAAADYVQMLMNSASQESDRLSIRAQAYDIFAEAAILHFKAARGSER